MRREIADFRRCICTLMLCLIASFGADCVASSGKNILLIIADDYGVDSSSLYNSTNTVASLPPTTNVVSLAQQGIVFRNAYAYRVSPPIRSCLITGLYGFR